MLRLVESAMCEICWESTGDHGSCFHRDEFFEISFGGMEGPGQSGAGEKEKEWTDYVAEYVRAFGIGCCCWSSHSAD